MSHKDTREEWGGEVPHSTHLLQVQAVGDVICSHEGGHQVCDGTSFSTMRTEEESVHATLSEDKKAAFMQIPNHWIH